MTNVLFKPTENGQVILRRKGVFYQRRVYHRKGYAYAALGAGFLGLYHNKGTSHSDYGIVDFVDPDHEYEHDSLGRLKVRGSNEPY